MARPLRLDFDGAWHHVTNRGAQRRLIYLDDDDRRLFLALLAEAVKRHRLELHAYCLMGNHYHLLIHTPTAGLSRGMHYLNGRYAQRFNVNHSTDGPLFGGRFHGTLVQSDEHLQCVVRYIDQNPVEAGMVAEPSDYAWSSHRAYLGFEGTPGWLRTDTMLNRLNGRSGYVSFVDRGVDDATAAHFSSRRNPPVLGDPEFRASFDASAESPLEVQPDVRRLAAASIEEVERRVAQRAGVDVGLVTAERRLRLIAMFDARSAGISLDEIAAHFGYAHGRSAGAIISRFETDNGLRAA